MASTFDTIAVELGFALSPLTEALENPANVQTLLSRLGWTLPPGISDIGLVGAPIQAVIDKLKIVITSSPAEWEDEFTMLTRTVELTVAIGALIERIVQIANGLSVALASTADYVARTKMDEELLPRLLDYLLIQYIAGRAPMAFAFLQLLTIFENRLFPAVSADYQSKHVRAIIHYDRIGMLLSDPAELFQTGYGWGTTNYDAKALLSNAALVLQMLGGSVQMRPMTRKVEEAILGRSVPEAVSDPAARIIINLLREAGTMGSAEVGLSIYETRPSGSGSVDGGLGVMPIVRGVVGASIPLYSDEVFLELEAGADLGNGVNLIVRPKQPPILQTALFGGASSTSGRLSAGIRYGADDSEPKTMLSFPGGSKLEVQKVQFKSGVERVSGGDYDAFAEFDLTGLRLLISLSSADSFLKSAASSIGELSINFDTSIGWSKTKGLYFRGSGGMEATLPLHIDLFGVLKIDSVYLSLQAKNVNTTVGIELIAATSISLKLGPVEANVEQIGMSARLTFPPNGGNLGPASMQLGFKPPKGVGFVIDASTVIGGGYLYLDSDKGQYAGVLQLEVKGGISIKAIALITTIMPDGSPGFSLLIIIAVEFSPITLGYGFTLNGVGGLAGLNRGMNTDALRDGIKNRTLDSIMFPPDPIRNAQKIISDLQTVFPPARDRFVFAPMVKIGWGAGILIIEIGVIVALPSPIIIAIMGKFHLKLPPLEQGGDSKESKNLVEIHMDVLGIIDFDRGEVSIDAILYDSRLVIFPITGGMAMRLRWGNNPVFIISIGGFNPRFAPPPKFPVLDRLGLQLSYDQSGIKARLRLVMYLAVTPNTLQLGALIEAYAEISAVTVTGYIGFDVLIEFHPFHFIVDLYGGVIVKAFGFEFSVDLLLTLSGPEPFLGDGHATVNFLGKHEVPIQFSIGQDPTTSALPPVDPLEALQTALADPRNWSAALPSGDSMLVTMRQLSTAETQGKVLAHPRGELTVRQKVVPFGIALQRFGAAEPTTPGPFGISSFHIGASQASVPAPAEKSVSEAFSRGQFVNLSEDAKLSTPAFEFFPSGQTRIGTGAIIKGAAQSAVFEYDVTIIDDKDSKVKRTSKNANDGITTTSITSAAFIRAAQYGAAKQTPMQQTGSTKFAGPVQAIKVTRPKYIVVSTNDFDVRLAREFDTYTEGEALSQNTKGTWQVVETYEVL